MQTSTGSAGPRAARQSVEPRSPWLEIATVLGALGAGIGAASAGLFTLLASVDPTHERLQDVLGVVALGCGAALVVGLVYRRRDARVQLAVHLSASLLLAVGLYAVLLERGDVDLAVAFLAYWLLAPLVLCAIAVVAAATIAFRSRAENGWRYVLAPTSVAIAAAAIPFLGAVSGDPGDAPEAAIRSRLGSDTLVTCSTWELEPGTLLCAVDARAWGAEDCLIRLGPGGVIARSRSLWAAEDAGDDLCRSLERRGQGVAP